MQASICAISNIKKPPGITTYDFPGKNQIINCAAVLHKFNISYISQSFQITIYQNTL